MKTLLVTSEVTYVPSNYRDLFETLLARAPEHIAGLVILRNLSLKLLRDTVGLKLMGAGRVSASLFRNICELPFARREKLFRERGIPVIRAESMNSPEMIDFVRNTGIDLIVNLRTRCIYKKPILSAPKIGCINIHHGLLPEYRGTLCDLYALHEGRPAGFTIHVMNEKIDAGQILLRREVSMPGERDYVSYLAKTGTLEGEALADLLIQIAAKGHLPEGIPNTTREAVYTRNPNRGRIALMKKEGMIL